VNCLGTCALAPVLVVDETYHEKVTPDKLRRILDQHREAAVAAKP
jgi:NADH-quinone oxidoreductase subunit E